MNWKFKALVQRTLDRLPAGRFIYGLGQQKAGSLRGFRVHSKAEQGLRLLDIFRKANQSVLDMDAVEVGTGWVPVIPMLFWLNGLKSCHTYDIVDLMSGRLAMAAAVGLADLCRQENGGAQSALTFSRERLEAFQSVIDSGANIEQILSFCGIARHAPADAGATAHANDSMDLVFSNTVMQNVPVPEIRRILIEAFRILKPGAWMIHHIDPSDMFSHADRSISGINFLQFSEREFAKYNTSFCYQNRLRALQYRQLMIEAGFEIAAWETRLNEKALSILPTLRLSPDFAKFAPEEICSFSIRAVARKPYHARES